MCEWCVWGVVCVGGSGVCVSVCVCGGSSVCVSGVCGG